MLTHLGSQSVPIPRTMWLLVVNCQLSRRIPDISRALHQVGGLEISEMCGCVPFKQQREYWRIICGVVFWGLGVADDD